MTDIERDQLHLRLIAEAVADVQRRISLTQMDQFLNDRDEQALTAFMNMVAHDIIVLIQVWYGTRLRHWAILMRWSKLRSLV